MALLVLAVMPAAACAGGSSAGHGGAAGQSLPLPSGSPSRDPLAPAPGRLGGELHPLPTNASPSPAPGRRVSLPWTYAGQRQGGRVLVVETVVSGCTRFSFVAVTEQPSSVEVVVWGRRPTAATVCPALAQVVAGTVTLSRPLGHRTLLHAPVSLG